MPTADPILAASGGNLSPGSPFLGTAAAGGNLAPTTPGLTQAAAGGNLSPTTPGLTQAAGGGVTGVPGTAQLETATVVAPSGCTSNGSLVVSVTAAGVTGSPLVFSVPLTTSVHTTAALIAAAAAVALSASANLAAMYNVTSSGATLILAAKLPAANDGTLNIQIVGGNGVTTANTSANTTAGVAPSGLLPPALLTAPSLGNLSPTTPGGITA